MYNGYIYVHLFNCLMCQREHFQTVCIYKRCSYNETQAGDETGFASVSRTKHLELLDSFKKYFYIYFLKSL